MKTTFKLDARHQLRSSKECFKLLGNYLIICSILSLIIFHELAFLLIICFSLCIWFLTAVIFVLPLHIQYLIKNWKTELTIDDATDIIQIKQSGIVYEYRRGELTNYQYLLGHYKPGRIKSFWVPFDYYGFIKIVAPGDKEFNFTSLMIDPFYPPVKIYETLYGFPFV